MSKIKVENLIKIFGDHTKKALKLLEKGETKDSILEKTGNTVGVNNVSFEVYKDEILVVMGLSGSGKSTLVRCLNRLIEPTSGKIYIDNQEVAGMSMDKLRELRRKKIGMVFQKFALFPHRTVLSNVEYGLEVQGVEINKRKSKAMEALELVGLKGWEDSLPNQLSGGMQQRVGLARALAVDPDILLMDEAFSALDPLIRRDMQDELLALHNRVGKTIVFITHDLDEAIKLGDRIILMKDGAIVQQGTAEDILTNPSSEYVEKFVEHVDMSKVLTAEGVMKDEKTVAFPKDGPRTVLRKLGDAGISSIFVVDNEHRVQGILLADKVSEAVEAGIKTIKDLYEKDITTVGPDTPLNELFEKMADIRYPLAVVDNNNKLLGVVVRGSVLAGLAKKGGV